MAAVGYDGVPVDPGTARCCPKHTRPTRLAGRASPRILKPVAASCAGGDVRLNCLEGYGRHFCHQGRGFDNLRARHFPECAQMCAQIRVWQTAGFSGFRYLFGFFGFFGGCDRDRTCDPLIKSQEILGSASFLIIP